MNASAARIGSATSTISCARPFLALRSQAIANAPHRLDLVTERAELLAQPQHDVIHRTVAADIRLLPDGIIEIGAAEGASGAAQEQVQQRKLRGAEVQRFAGQCGAMRSGV